MFNFSYKKKLYKKELPTRLTETGFSLIELIVSFAIFGFVSVAAVSAMLAVIDGNRKSQSLTSAMDNLNFVMESITRELRVGYSYDCSGAGTDCPNGGTGIAFLTSDSDPMTYQFVGTSVERIFNGNTEKMTGPNIVINRLTFFVQGTINEDEEQPRVTIIISGIAGVGDTVSNFDIQTTVTQRFPDI